MTYEQLRTRTDEEVEALYDKTAKHTSVGLSFYADELARRRTVKSEKMMLKYTKWITLMTFAMLLFTVVNIITAIFSSSHLCLERHAMRESNIIRCDNESTIVCEYTPDERTAADYQSEADLEE